uniref:RRM domain-containing protein n=1 Tax=Oryctolagus cuniculus TaxID=9986 RepID=G1U223_RABIT
MDLSGVKKKSLLGVKENNKKTALMRSLRTALKIKGPPRSPVRRTPARTRHNRRDGKQRKRWNASPKPTKVHIGRLTRNMTKDHIMEIFSTYGKIKMIDMPVIYEAKKALKHMDGAQNDGQEITATAMLASWPRPHPWGFIPPRRMLLPPPMWHGSPPMDEKVSSPSPGRSAGSSWKPPIGTYHSWWACWLPWYCSCWLLLYSQCYQILVLSFLTLQHFR